jgi:hypothetical protein
MARRERMYSRNPPGAQAPEPHPAGIRPSASRNSMASWMPDDISPELALVWPELASEARLRLPERPWEEAFARMPPGGVARQLQPALHERNVMNVRSLQTVASSGALSAGRADSHTARVRRRRSVSRVLFAATAIALAVVGVLRSGFWDVAWDEGAPTRSPASPERQPTLLPGSGYVVFPAGNFMTDPSGRTIEFFTLPLRCGSRELVLEDVPVSAGAIRFTGKTAGGVIVHVTGRLLDRQRVRGFASASGPRCSTGRVAFSARLS